MFELYFNRRLNFHDFLFFSFTNTVNVFNEIIGDFLYLLLSPVQVIFRDNFFVLKITQVPDAFPANITNRNAGFFTFCAYHLNELESSFLCGSWQNQADILSVIIGI